MNFVDALHAGWSISIFHYRNHGADVGRIVVGVLFLTGTCRAGPNSSMPWAIATGMKPTTRPMACSSEIQGGKLSALQG